MFACCLWRSGHCMLQPVSQHECMQELLRKVGKLEQLLQLKDAKIQSLLARLQLNTEI